MSDDDGGFSQEEQDASDLCYALALNLRDAADELLSSIGDAPIADLVRAVVDEAKRTINSVESGTAGEARNAVADLAIPVEQLMDESNAEQPSEYTSVVDGIVDMYAELVDAVREYQQLMEG